MFHNSSIYLELTAEQFNKVTSMSRFHIFNRPSNIKVKIGDLELNAMITEYSELFPIIGHQYEVKLSVSDLPSVKSPQESLAEKSVKEARKALEAAEEVLKKIQSEKGK